MVSDDCVDFIGCICLINVTKQARIERLLITDFR
jgi:hypothetical protein